MSLAVQPSSTSNDERTDQFSRKPRISISLEAIVKRMNLFGTSRTVALIITLLFVLSTATLAVAQEAATS